MDGPHTQYIQAGIVFSYIFQFGLEEHGFIIVRRIPVSGARFAGARKVHFLDLSKDNSLEVHSEECS